MDREIFTFTDTTFLTLLSFFRRFILAAKSVFYLRHDCPSIAMYHRGFYCTSWCKIWEWVLLWKSVDKNQMVLKSTT